MAAQPQPSGEAKAKKYLLPSALYIEREPTLVSTVLGSCVAVCLYDPVLLIGGINHFMLPLWNGDGLASVKYGNIAMEKLLDGMLKANSRKINLVAKMFGGAMQLTENDTFGIGRRNIEVARLFLNEHRIKIVAENVGGKLGRHIMFDTQTGQVGMRIVGVK